MTAYFELYGQYIPNTAEMHLPIRMTKQDVYFAYVRAFGDGAVKLSHFYKVWEEVFPMVKCTKWSSFNKCALCSDLRSSLESAPEAKKGKHDSSLPLVSSCRLHILFFSFFAQTSKHGLISVLFCMQTRFKGSMIVTLKKRVWSVRNTTSTIPRPSYATSIFPSSLMA